jgi:catalase
VTGLTAAAKEEGVNVELVAPAVGGVETSDGTKIEADQQVDGGPSVLYDAVVLFPSAEGAPELVSSPAARDFVTNAYAHSKFIGYVPDATPLFEATGIDRRMDDGFIEIGNGGADPAGFLSQCRQLRYWPREAASTIWPA